MRSVFAPVLLLLSSALAACASAAPREAVPIQAHSLLGEPLFAPALAPETRLRLERDLAAARAEYNRDPGDADAIIWLGRRTAYLGRFREAIEIFSEGIAKHPDDARMYRHRGHRWITVRELDRAVADFERAAELIRGRPDEVEPDGAPNRYNIPTSTLHSNIWYHLGLALYLQGRFEEALAAYRRCMEVSDNDDMRVATADWLYMTLRRLGRDEEAAAVLEPIRREMRILENHAYHRRLLFYRGELPVDSLLDARGADALQMATQGYGVGNWYLYNGDVGRAREVFRQVISYGNWPAFGHIAAEAELAREQRPAAAQPGSPEAVARAYFAALEAGQWEVAAALVQPAVARQLREIARTQAAALSPDQLPTVEQFLHQDPEMPREVAEYQVRRIHEGLTGQPPVLQLLAGVHSVAEAETLSDRDVIARYLQAQDPVYRFELARREWERRNVPGVASVEGLGRIRRAAVGLVQESEALAHVVYRIDTGRLRSPLDGRMAVVTLVSTPDGWRVRDLGESAFTPEGAVVADIVPGDSAAERPR